MSASEIGLRPKPSLGGWVDNQALRDVAPILVSLAPFALVLGIAMSDVGIATTTGVVGSFIIWAGSAQLAGIALMDAGAGILAIAGAVIVINARFVMYAAALEPRFRDQPVWFRWLGPHFIVDQNYALATSRSDLDDPARFRRYWITVSAAIGVVWLSTIAAGSLFGAALPPGSPLGFASITVFIGLLVPRLKERRALQAAAIASVATVVGAAFPSGSGLLFGVLAGTFIPSFIKRREIRESMAGVCGGRRDQLVTPHIADRFSPGSQIA